MRQVRQQPIPCLPRIRQQAHGLHLARSLGTPATATNLHHGSDSASNVANSGVWDMQLYTRALTNTEIADMHAARDVP